MKFKKVLAGSLVTAISLTSVNLSAFAASWSNCATKEELKYFELLGKVKSVSAKLIVNEVKPGSGFASFYMQEMGGSWNWYSCDEDDEEEIEFISSGEYYVAWTCVQDCIRNKNGNLKLYSPADEDGYIMNSWEDFPAFGIEVGSSLITEEGQTGKVDAEVIDCVITLTNGTEFSVPDFDVKGDLEGKEEDWGLSGNTIAVDMKDIIIEKLAEGSIPGESVPSDSTDIPDPTPGDSTDIPDDPIDYGDYWYEVLDDGTIEITGYKGNDTVLKIPSEIDGKKVTCIGEDAFSVCKSLTSITIPNGVTSIGYRAFAACSSLASITIPDSVTIPNSVTSIGYSMFEGCESLTNIAIPDSVTNIRCSAFLACSGLTSINVSKDNKYYCSVDGVLFDKEKTEIVCYPAGKSDKSYTIPNSVTSIGEYAFSHCESLTSITIPNSVTSIGNYAFYDCSNLTSIAIPNGVTRIEYSTFAQCSSLTSITIPDSVTSIGEDAFRSCNSLTSITIPNSVTSIGDGAFSYCTCLTSITIPDSVASIGDGAFEYCTSLPSINVSKDNKNYCAVEGVLFNKDKTEIICYPTGKPGNKYVIPNNVTSIAIRTFYGCASLTSITISDSVTRIEGGAFSCCESLTSITIPDNVTSIEFNTFAGCSSLTSITIPDSVTSIGYGAFYFCSNLESIIIPESVTCIGDWAFEDCISLTSITISNSVTSIGQEAFYECLNLTDVYYTGTEEQWDDIYIDDYNDCLLNATVHYNHTHSFGTWTTTKAATCVADGSRERTCSCGKTETEAIKATGHTVVTDKAVVATCTADGKTEGSHCSVCNAVIKAQEVVKATGHTSVSANNGKAATCTAAGKESDTKCSVCGITLTTGKTIAAKGHTYTTKVVAPTTSAQGYTLHTCSVCGNSYKDNYKDKLPTTTTVAQVTGLKTAGRAANALRISWTKVANADGYIVEMYKGSKWTQIAKITKNTTTEWKQTGLAAGTVYKFRVKAYKGTTQGKYSAEYSSRTNPSKVAGLKLKGRASNALRIAWNKNTSADGYIVEMYKGGKWVRVAKISKNTTTEWKQTKLAAGTAYKFRVKSYKMSGKTALYGTAVEISARTSPSNVTGMKTLGRAKTAVRFGWKKNTSADGYIVEMYKDGKWVRAAKIAKNSTVEFKKTGLKANTTYKFRIRAYKMSGKTALYSGYTNYNIATTK